jgi:hypothetical protein
MEWFEIKALYNQADSSINAYSFISLAASNLANGSQNRDGRYA